MTTQNVQAALQTLNAKVGMESVPVTHLVEAGHIRRFAEAIGDANPRYVDERAARKGRAGGIVAPPTFLRALVSNPLDVESPLTRRLDGGSAWEYFDHVRPGDRITVTTRFSEVSSRPGRLGDMLIMTREVRYVNQFGDLVAVQRGTSISY